MSDAVETPVQPEASGQPENWKARYDGLVRKVEQLTLQNRDLTTDLGTKASEIEQLRAQLGIKDAEKTAAVSERDKQLQELVQSKTGLESELSELRAMKLKVKMVNELKAPHLLRILDKVPNMTDEEALRSVLKDFDEFGKDLVREREQQLLAGIVPGQDRGGGPKKATPASAKEWEGYLNGLAPGSKEHDQAMDEYWDWTSKQP